MNAIILMVAMSVGQCGPGGCPAPARSGMFGGLFGGSRYSYAAPAVTYAAPPVVYAAPTTYADAGGCYGGSVAASCYSVQYAPAQSCQPQQAQPSNRVPSPPPAMGYRGRRAMSDYPDLPAPELTTYGVKREDGTYLWGVSKEEAIAAWKRGENIPKSRNVVNPQAPKPKRPATRFVSNDEPKMPLAEIADIKLVNTATEKVFDLDSELLQSGSQRLQSGEKTSSAAPPPMTGEPPTGNEPGPPPAALYCPGCGGVRAGNFRQDDSDEDCVVTCLHPGCSYRFSWKNTPAQWRQVMQRCPYCRTGLNYANGEVQCPKCWFEFVIDQTEFNGEFRSSKGRL